MNILEKHTGLVLSISALTLSIVLTYMDTFPLTRLIILQIPSVTYITYNTGKMLYTMINNINLSFIKRRTENVWKSLDK